MRRALLLAALSLLAAGCTERRAVRRGPVDSSVPEQTGALNGRALPGEYGLPDTAAEQHRTGELRYRVASLDPVAGRVSLVPAWTETLEREPQAGIELVLTLDDVRRLARTREDTEDDVVSRLRPGTTVLVVPAIGTPPASADDIVRIRVP